MTEKLPLSVSIISFNEERIISKALESIADIASEIIVIDSGSTDSTRSIAESYGAKVFIEEWKGHIAHKNLALSKCTQQWILSIDCDEVVTDELKQNIIRVINANTNSAYLINRKTFYLGKLLNHAWQPDWNLRLIPSGFDAKWDGLDPHDKLIFNGKKERIDGSLIHYSYNDLTHHFDKTILYAKISAISYINAGKHFKMINLIINPIVAFTKIYFLRKGFLDGVRGLIAAFSSMFGTFLKYCFIFEIRKSNK